MQREKKKEVEIQAALDQSKRAMRFGDTFGAVSALESVKQVTDPTVFSTVMQNIAAARPSTQQQYYFFLVF